MRSRGTALLFLTAVLAVSFQSHALSPSVSAFAANVTGKAIALQSDKNTLVVKFKPGEAPVKAKLNCLEVYHFGSGIYAPPLPTLPSTATYMFARAKAGAKTYYLFVYSVAPPGDEAAQAVTAMSITTKPFTVPGTITFCGGVPAGPFTPAAGVAVFR
jgi:hypothetical protein